MKKKKLLLLELCLLCMVTSGFKTKESEPLYVGVTDVNKEADLGFKDYLDVYSYEDMKRMVNDKKIKKYENEIESITERYSNIYGIKSNVINKIIENNTDNYSSANFQNNKNIYGKEEKFDSYNKQILLLIRDVYYNPEKYNLNKNEIMENEFHQDIKLRDFVYEISDLFGVDHDMALSIACAESGYFEASIATSRNNPYALNSSNGFIYFDNIYEQNNAGNSIDCDMMANTSLLTLGKSITFITNPEVQYESLPRILSQNGYYTVSNHAEDGGDWKWAEAHKNALGFDEILGKYSYNIDEKVGFGLSDRSFLKQYLSKLKTFKEPFYSTIATLSSHGPFDIQKKYRELKLPKEVDKSYLGGYFQSVHYTDKEIGKFIKGLKESGLLKNTVLVIYGDHTGVHKYYNKQIQDVPLEGVWWKKQDHKIPLIIYGENIKPKTISTYGGQIDIEPTVLYLLGINTKDKYFMGRNLLNTKRNATVLKGSKVIGSPSKEDRERLKEAYKIAEYIINNDYFVNRGLVN